MSLPFKYRRIANKDPPQLGTTSQIQRIFSMLTRYHQKIMKLRKSVLTRYHQKNGFLPFFSRRQAKILRYCTVVRVILH